MANAQQTTSVSTDVTSRLRAVFCKKLLKELQYLTVREQFRAEIQNINQQDGGTSITYFKPRRAYRGDISVLTEGTVPTKTLTQVESGKVNIQLYQIGTTAQLSDVRKAADIFNWMDQHYKTMAADAALNSDCIIAAQNVRIMKNRNDAFELFAGQAAPTSAAGNTSGDRFTALQGTAAAGAIMTRKRALAAVTQMKKYQVPTINGRYVAVVAPEVIHDIRQDSTWVSAATNVDVSKLYKRANIEIDGVLFVETNNPWTETTTYANIASDTAGMTAGPSRDTTNPENDIFVCEFFGLDSFGCPKFNGLGDPWSPQIIVLDKPDKTDPLNQYAQLGWKAMWNSKPLLTDLSATMSDATTMTDVPNMVLLRVKSSFNGAA